MLKINKINACFLTTALTIFGSLVTEANEAIININNAGFEDASGDGGNGYLSTLADWTEEESGDSYTGVFVDNNGNLHVPEASRTLCLQGPGTAAVNQNLNRNWSSSDIFTLDMIAMNPRWWDGNNTFIVELRQADGTVLWDSGNQNVGGTVTTTSPATYTGTGHIFSWDIDASTFAGAGVVENSQLNVRIAYVSGGPVFADNVSLSVVYEPSSAAPTLTMVYAPDAAPNPTVTLTWSKFGAASYIAKYSTDMSDWGSDLGDAITAADDENPTDADHITATFQLIGGLENEPKMFFRIEDE